MATYANFHHIELDNIGNRKSVTPRPIGGKATIFDATPEPPPSTPRKVNNRMKSNPLGLDQVDKAGKVQSLESPPRSKQGSPTPTQSSDDVSDTCSETSSISSLSTPTKVSVVTPHSTPRSGGSGRIPPGGYSHKLW